MGFDADSKEMFFKGYFPGISPHKKSPLFLA
jgi:hypothetical protein